MDKDGQPKGVGCMMRTTNITFMDVENNQKERFDYCLFKHLCKEVRRLKIKNLEVIGKSISKLSTRKRRELLSALINNFHLQTFASINKYFHKEERKELEAVLERNRLLYAEKLSQYNIVKWLQKNPLAKDSEAVDAVIAMIEAYKDQFQQARAAMLPYANEKRMARLNRRMDVLMSHAGGWMKDNKEGEAAMHYYLTISPQSDKYIAARYAAFELAYVGHHDVNNAFPALTAFMNALPCCLDAQSRLIDFVGNKQKVFAGYLCAAAGMSNGYLCLSGDKMGKVETTIIISDEQRHILLAYILMRHVCLSLPNASTSEIKLFQEREGRLKRQFNMLPKVECIADVDKLMSTEKPSFYEVWNKTAAVVPSLQDANLALLCKSIAPKMNAEEKPAQRFSAA